MYSDTRGGRQIIETNTTYPNGRKQRNSIATSDRLACTVCDPIGRQEVCVSNYCVHLGNTAVFVFVNNGTLTESFQLNGCSPRYLQPSTVTETTTTTTFVVCRPTDTGQPQYRDLSFNGRQFRFTSKIILNGNNFPLSPHNGVFSGGQDETYFQQDFFLYIRGNEVFLEVVGGYVFPRQLHFQPGICDTKDALHAMPPRDNKPQFLLECTKSNVTKWFIVNVDTPDDLYLEVTEINHSSGGTPFASATVIVFVNSNNLTVYEVANLQNYPGTKTFSGPIKQIDLLSSNQLLVVVSTRNHSLINIPVFVQTEGVHGVAELPSSIAYCPIGGTCLPHKLVNQDILVLFIHNQTFYDAVFYNLTDSDQRLGTLPRFINRPQVVFYDRLPSPPTAVSPPTTLSISSPSASPLKPSPLPSTTIVSTTTSNLVSSLTVPSSISNPVVGPSSVLPGVTPSSLPIQPTPIDPTKNNPQLSPITGLTHEAAITIAVVVPMIVIFIITAAIVLLGRYMYIKKKFSVTTSPKQESPSREAPLGEETTTVNTVTPAPSSDEEPSSGYSSRAHSPTNLTCPAINAGTRQSNCSADSFSSLSPAASAEHVAPCDQPRDEVVPPDGTSQGGDIATTPANVPPPSTKTVLVTGSLQS